MEVLIKVMPLFYVVSKVNTEPNEVEHAYKFYVSSTENFNDIYKEEIITIPGQDELETTTEDEFLNTIQTQLDFGHYLMATPQLVIPPKYISDVTNSEEKGSSASTTVIQDPEEAIRVVPIKRERGILDLLFPSTRVKNFKSIFDSVKRLLSHTFKR